MFVFYVIPVIDSSTPYNKNISKQLIGTKIWFAGGFLLKAYSLNPTLIGQILVGLIPVSNTLGHRNPKKTISCMDNKTEPEIEFINDLLNLSSEDIIQKWYGTREEIVNMLLKLKN